MEVRPGQTVSINPQSDKTREILVKGVVKDVLTRNQDHPHGVKVILESGEVGRVKEIHSDKTEAESASEKAELGAASLQRLIAGGENHLVEFKTSALWSKYLSKEEMAKSKSVELKTQGNRASSFILAKSIAGFANADGGNLIVGVKEDKVSAEPEVIGVESEFGKLKDSNTDGYRRMIIDDVVLKFLPDFFLHRINDYLRISFEEIAGHEVCHITVLRGDQAVFVKSNREQFFVRIEASTREIAGEGLVEYCRRRFGRA